MRRWKNEWLKDFSERKGLEKGETILVRERSMLKDGSYITRKRRYGRVLQLYPYHFYCLMEDGTKESFRYNEFLGYESRLVRLKDSAEGNMNDRQLNRLEIASVGRFFYAFLEMYLLKILLNKRVLKKKKAVMSKQYQ